MALPIAHWAVALAVTRSRDQKIRALAALLAVIPDFDFILVWGLGLPLQHFHRTFSHSLISFALVSLFWAFLRPSFLKEVSPQLVFVLLASHSAVDLACTSDVVDHGVELFWPLLDVRLGWPLLVPLYRVFAESPFSLEGALLFTLLELILALLLWLLIRLFRPFRDSRGRGTGLRH